jgi:plastocyanin
MRRSVLIAVVVAVGVVGIQLPGAAEGEGAGGTITGQVQFVGAPPARTPVKMSADPTCQQRHAEPALSEDVIVNDNGTLRNVFVYVKEGLTGAFPPATTPVVLDQDGCLYRPRVVGLQVNQPLEIRNSDATLHNVNAKPGANKPFNVAQPVQGMKTTKTFSSPEVMVGFKCNVHPWMRAYVGVVAHPFFAVSDDTGAFTISGLPAGTYTFEAWHEVYGTQSQAVTVADGQSATVTFSFSAN